MTNGEWPPTEGLITMASEPAWSGDA